MKADRNRFVKVMLPPDGSLDEWREHIAYRLGMHDALTADLRKAKGRVAELEADLAAMTKARDAWKNEFELLAAEHRREKAEREEKERQGLEALVADLKATEAGDAEVADRSVLSRRVAELEEALRHAAKAMEAHDDGLIIVTSASWGCHYIFTRELAIIEAALRGGKPK